MSDSDPVGPPAPPGVPSGVRDVADGAVRDYLKKAAADRERGPDVPFYTDVEIGMPLTGRCNLAEGPLLQLVGDLQWKHMSRISGVPSREIVDEEGARLYATFFYVETRFPRERPMGDHGENDRLTIASTLRRFGRSMLEGSHYLLPRASADALPIPPESPKEARRAGVPYVRFCNSFVKQWQGAEWLKKSRPANEGIARIRELPRPPVPYLLFKRAEKLGSFFRVPEGWVPLAADRLETGYEVVADRDLNGAGLLYFAVYPVVLDICERRLLAGLEGLSFSHELLDRRTVVQRASGYFSNASADETLLVQLEGWIESPFLTGHPSPEEAPIRLLLDYRMLRRSDRRLMMLSSVKKTVHGVRLGDTPLLEELRRRTCGA